MRRAYIASTAAAVLFAGIFVLGSLGLINLPVKQFANDLGHKSEQPTELCSDESRTGSEWSAPNESDASISYRLTVDTKASGALSLEQVKQMLGAEVVSTNMLLVKVNKNNINKLNDYINNGVFLQKPASKINIAVGCRMIIEFR